MDSGNISAIISASAGLLGVILGNSYVAVKEYVAGRRTRRESTLYLGILVVSHLERFANDCVQAAQDDGTARGRPAGSDGIQYVVTTDRPEFLPLSINVDWKLLPASLLYPILSLPDDQEALENQLAGISEFDDDYPEHTECFWVRQTGYAELGLLAEKLALNLRSHCGMPALKTNATGWSRTQTFVDVTESIKAKRSAFDHRQAGSSFETP